jgi:hypothetical protein
VIIVLVFYILTILEYYFAQMPNVERPYKAFGYRYYLLYIF